MGLASKQKQIIDDGTLDKLGSGKGDSLKLSKTAQALVDMAANLITQSQNNLNRAGAEATGELEASIHAEDIVIDGSKLSIDVVLLDRYKFTNDGVKGTNGGTGKFQFKTKYPSKKMATSILKWIRKRGIRGKLAAKYKPISTTEKKDVQLKKIVDTADNYKSLAYAIATNVKKKGIKPTHFFTKAVKDTEQKWKAELLKGFKLDIIESLK